MKYEEAWSMSIATSDYVEQLAVHHQALGCFCPTSGFPSLFNLKKRHPPESIGKGSTSQMQSGTKNAFARYKAFKPLQIDPNCDKKGFHKCPSLRNVAGPTGGPGPPLQPTKELGYFIVPMRSTLTLRTTTIKNVGPRQKKGFFY